MDKDFKNADNDVYANFDGYTTVDASIAIPVYDGTLSIGIQNLLNEDYYTYYSQTVGTDTRYFKGMGRTATIGFTLPF
jgi:iron complex outermembrane receptor protein